jgi:hypothetical protein
MDRKDPVVQRESLERWVADQRLTVRERLIRRAPKRFDVEFAVCGIFRDEGPYLDEWIEFHRARGAERFYLYDNRSTDGWGSEAPDVQVKPWPDHPGQFSAYADCLDEHRRDTRWIAFIDIDEFLFSPTGDSLPDVLAGFGNVSSVCANWRVYGTSGHQEPTFPVTEKYLWRAGDDYPRNRIVKSVVYPLLTSSRVQTAHVFRTYGAPVGEDGKPVSSALRDPPTAELLRVNHYETRSVSEFRRKRKLDDTRGKSRTEWEVAVPPNEILDPVLAESPYTDRPQSER